MKNSHTKGTRMREKVTDAYESARPYVERLARDEDLHDHVKKAYESARKVYDEVIAPTGPTAVAMRVAKDKDIQNELRKAIEELRKAGERARGESHTGRNMTLLLAGITIGILFNPMTGPETRKWIREKLLGPEEPFEYRSNPGSSNES
jgi:hypothetical protein